MSNSDNFKKELKILLIRYDAHIAFTVGDDSDTHGLYDEQLEVNFNGLKAGDNFKSVTETVVLAHGWSVDKSDL